MRRTKLEILTLCAIVSIGVFLGMGGSTRDAAAASDYPNKTITITLGVPPGGSTDMGARLLAQFMEKQLKQPVVVVNKPGAAATIGGYAVASAKPDGYTLGYFPGSGSVPEVYSYFYSAPYSSSDLRPISRIHAPVIAVAVKSDAPWNSMKEFIEYARKNPGTKFGHIGKSTTQYVIMSTIIKAEKLNMVDVPFDGDGTMVPALLGGHVPIATPVLYVIRSLVEGKKLKVLGVAVQKRAPSVPDVPTLAELGYKLPFTSFLGMFAPKKTPDEIVKKLEDTIRKVLDDKEFQEKNKAMDMPVDYDDAVGFEKYLANYKTTAQAFFKEQGLTK